MLPIKHRFTLDMHSTQSQISIPVMLGDTGREWHINLSDGGKLYTIADGCLAKISIKRPTETHLEEFCTIEGNTTIVYDFSQNQNTAAVEGIHDCDVTLYGLDGKVITTARFTMVVSERAVSGDDIIIYDEDYTAVDAMLTKEAERQAAETHRADAENQRADAETKRVSEFAKLKEQIKSAFIRYSANADGTDFTEEWSEGQNYIGFATGQTAPTDKSGYEWGYIGNDVPLERGTGYRSVQMVGSEARGAYSSARGAMAVMTTTNGIQECSNKATGLGATAEGCGTVATGDGSHAEGTVGKISKESDEYMPTTAENRGSHAEGCGTVSSGIGSHSEGYNSKALEEASHSEGKRTQSIGYASHSEGQETEAHGVASHAEGIKGKAMGKHSHVEGADGEAWGNNSHVEGWGCWTDPDAGASHAGGEGAETTAYGAFSHGAYTRATEKYQVVFGKANAESPSALFIIGNGKLNDDDTPIEKYRSNAFQVLQTKETGEVYIMVGSAYLAESHIRALLDLLK